MTEAGPLQRKFQKELNAGTVSLVLLGVLDQAAEPLYGYRIAKLLEERSEGTLMMKQGSLYPVLRSLQRSGLLESRVEPSLAGPPRRYYRITDAGRRILRDWIALWNRNKCFVDDLLEGGEDV